MKKNFSNIYYLTKDQFNLKLINLRRHNEAFKLEILPTKLCLTADKYYCFDLVAGELIPRIDYGNMGKVFFTQTNTHIITEGYGRKEVPCPVFGNPDGTKIFWDYTDPGNYSYTDPSRKLEPLHCWGYDCNSAYPAAMMKDMPDTRKEPRYSSKVGEHEIGFYKNGAATTEVGRIANIVFPLMESPFKEPVMKYYKRKSEAKSKEERAKWKKWLVIPTGMLHRKNIFLRLAVLHYAKENIIKYIDDDTIYCNVDSIVSTKPRTDIPLGKELGLFKLEHDNEFFKYKDVGIYQWESECHYSGVKKNSITDIEDLSVYTPTNKYFYNEEKGLIEEYAKI